MTVPPIYVMAALTLAAIVLAGCGLLYAFSTGGRRTRFFWLLLPGLPLSALVNLAIKRPLAIWVGGVAGVAPGLGLDTPLWFILFLALLPPVTEEAIKVLPLVLPPVRRMVASRSDALWVGLALGIGFGLGEAAYLAYNVAHSEQFAAYPWYAFTGYLSERLVVSLAHGLLTAIVVAGLYRGGRHAVGGYLVAVLLHLLINTGAMLAQLGVIPVALAGISLVLGLLILAWIFERQRRAVLREEERAGQVEEVVYFQRRPQEPDGD